MNQQLEQLRAKARELLGDKTVQCVIGWERASDGISARPAFIYKPEDTDRLVFDKTCTHNLTRYLRDLPKGVGPTGVVVKPCDARAVNLLLNEKQFSKDKVYVIGLVCSGVDKSDWGQAGDKLQDRCVACRQHTPVVYDVLIGTPPAEEPAAPAYPDVAEYERRSPEGKRRFWEEQFANCIRCYACRQACPGCYCPECFVEQLDPTWVGIRIAPSENRVWNIIRAFHLAGRCVNCGACEQACPVGIPLMLLNHKLEKDAIKMFGFEAGMDAEKAAPFATFKKDEKLETVE